MNLLLLDIILLDGEEHMLLVNVPAQILCSYAFIVSGVELGSYQDAATHCNAFLDFGLLQSIL